jgi:hypothetical protein
MLSGWSWLHSSVEQFAHHGPNKAPRYSAKLEECLHFSVFVFLGFEETPSENIT